MKKLICRLMAMCFLTVSLAAFAQSGGDTMKHDDSMKQDNMKQDNMKQDNMKSDSMGKLMSLTGKIGDDGKSFVGDKDGKN